MTETSDVVDARDDRTQPQRGLLAVAAAAVSLLVLLYLFAVQTSWGQRLDATALQGRRGLHREGIHAAARLLTTIDVASLALLGGAIVLVALVRGRPRLAVSAFVLIAGSSITTEILKRVVLPRPDFGVFDGVGPGPTFPSGHTTVALSLGVGAMIVSPIRWRAVVAVLGAVFASVIGAATVASAAHRPSDPIGAALVVTAWAATVLASLIEGDRDAGPGRPPGREPGATPWIALGGVTLLVISFLALVATAIGIHRNRLDTVDLGGAFIGATSAIVGMVLVCVGLLLALLRGIDLDL